MQVIAAPTKTLSSIAPATALYVHLPFCAQRCGYCAFVVETGMLDQRDAYLDAVQGEIARRRTQLGTLTSVYLGGGTPTLMRPHRIARLLSGLGPYLGPNAEVTIEANPETVDRAALHALREAGVTRISIGVQSFQPRVLGVLDRQASPTQARDAVRCARAVGFDSISIDLLFGVPGTRPHEWAADVRAATEMDVDHISWYSLEIKPGTALERMGAALPDEDETADQYEEIVDALQAAGYRWYETANYAHAGHECRHNQAYWTAQPYIGVGVGAVSRHGLMRWRNAPGVERYIARHRVDRLPDHDIEALDEDVLRRERWMLGLRLADGIDTAEIGPPDHPEALEEMAAGGFLTVDGTHVRLTRRGRFVSNAVVGRLMDFA